MRYFSCIRCQFAISFLRFGIFGIRRARIDPRPARGTHALPAGGVSPGEALVLAPVEVLVPLLPGALVPDAVPFRALFAERAVVDASARGTFAATVSGGCSRGAAPGGTVFDGEGLRSAAVEPVWMDAVRKAWTAGESGATPGRRGLATTVPARDRAVAAAGGTCRSTRTAPCCSSSSSTPGTNAPRPC